MDVHLRDLRYFVAVAEDRSFSRAAARLYVSQPALSKQVRQLEQQLHARLLHRGPRGVTLTAAGEALLPHARDQLRRWAQARHQVVAAAAADTETLTIGFSTAVARGLLSAASDRFRAGQPRWRLQLRQVPWSDATAGLADAGVDVALLWLPLPDPDRFDWRILATEPRWVALPAGHPLAGRDVVPFAELRDEPFLALPDSAGRARDYWLALDSRGARPVRIGGVVTTAEETFEAVANGIGVALLSAGNAGIYRHSGVVCRPLTGVGPAHLAVAWRCADDRPVTGSFVAACVAAATPAPPMPAPVHREQEIVVAVSGLVDEQQQELLTAAARSGAGSPVPVTTITSDSTRSRVDAVLSGAADLAFVRLPESPDPELDYQHLATTPLLLAVPDGHPLARPVGDPGEGVPLRALHDEPLAFYHRDQNPWWYDDVLGRLRAAGVQPRIVHRGLWEYDVLPQVRSGRALALLTGAAAAAARLDGVRYRALVPASLTISHGIVWRRSRRSAAVERLVAAAAGTVSAGPPRERSGAADLAEPLSSGRR